MTFLAIRAQITGHMLTAAGCVAVIAQLWSLQSPLQHSPRRQVDASKPLAPIVGRLLNGTAFFVDQSGSMLTARHAVDHCARIVIAKEQHRMQARIVALSVNTILPSSKCRRLSGLRPYFRAALSPPPTKWCSPMPTMRCRACATPASSPTLASSATAPSRATLSSTRR
jgi:hypothetical protein